MTLRRPGSQNGQVLTYHNRALSILAEIITRKTMYLNSSIARRELAKVARGKGSRIPTKILAEYVLNYCMADSKLEPLQDDSVRWLKRLYALEDPRG